MISRDQALKRLAQCRELQKDQLTITVAADIVDAILEGEGDAVAALKRIAGFESGVPGWIAHEALYGKRAA